MEYQMRNWYYFNWLCGDHITEQHIHNLDVANWVKNATPAKAQGQGGRQVRTGKDHGEIYDHHFVEFTYPDGTVMLSQCRHQPQTQRSVSEHAHGAKGYCNIGDGRMTFRDGKEWRFQGRENDNYQAGARPPVRRHPREQVVQRGGERRQEHDDLDPRPHVHVLRPGDQVGRRAELTGRAAAEAYTGGQASRRRPTPRDATRSRSRGRPRPSKRSQTIRQGSCLKSNEGTKTMMRTKKRTILLLGLALLAGVPGGMSVGSGRTKTPKRPVRRKTPSWPSRWRSSTRAFKKLRRTLRKPDQNKESLEIINQIQAAAVASKARRLPSRPPRCRRPSGRSSSWPTARTWRR